MSRDGGLVASIDASGGAGGNIGLAVGGVVSGGVLKSSSNHGCGGGSSIRPVQLLLSTFSFMFLLIFFHLITSYTIYLTILLTVLQVE